MSAGRLQAIPSSSSSHQPTASDHQRLLSTYLPFAPHARSLSPSHLSFESPSLSAPIPLAIASPNPLRQTRIDQHLRAVKPGSPSPGAGAPKASSSSSASAAMRTTRRGRSSVQAKSAEESPAAAAATAMSAPSAAPPTITSNAQRKGKAVVQPSEASAGAASEGSSSVQPAAASLGGEKQALMHQLASHGITPSDQVLDETLFVLTSEKQDWTVEAFLTALARSGDPPPSPAVLSRGPDKLQVEIPQPPKSFSTLESPSTPPDTLRPAFDFSTSSPRPSQTDFEPLLRTPPRLLPALEPLPITPRTQRLAAFSAVSTPRPDPASARPTTRQTRRQATPAAPAAPLIPAAKTMVAAQVEGMGRVALSRSVLFSQLGEATAEQAIAAATLGPATPPLLFGAPSASDSTNSKAFDAFGAAVKINGPALSLKPRRGGGKTGSHVVDERLGRVRSWLESDGEEDDEDLDQKRGSTWSRAPKEWEADLAEEERQRLVEQKLEPEVEIECIDLEEEEEEDKAEEPAPVMHQQVRVGGKNIRVLLHTKRKRVQEDGGLAASEDAGSTVAGEEKDAEEEAADEETIRVIAALRTPPRTRTSLAMQLDRDESTRPNGKGRALEDTVDCICSTPDDEDQPMIQCDECRVWLHLACLNIPSVKRLPKEWSCFRCTDSAPPEPRSAKRVRVVEGDHEEDSINSPTTPTFAHEEPILVASSTSPRVRNNFYRGYAADMALAPSPQSSPIRRHATVPRSPVANNLVSIPVTPKLATDARADYSPRSPLFYRRTRLVSGGGDEIQGGWVGGWDGHVFGTSHDYHEHYPIEPEDDFQPKSWHDMTMTPSRTVASSFEWETPGTRPRGGASSGVTATPRSASQNFLSGLHAEPEPQQDVGGGHSRAPSYAQRLFGSPTHHHRVPSSTAAPNFPSPSPHKGPRGSIRQRVPSVPFGLQPSLSASSTSALASSALNPFTVGMARRGSLEHNVSASPYRTAMARTGSGSLEHAVSLDDLLAL